MSLYHLCHELHFHPNVLQNSRKLAKENNGIMIENMMEILFLY